MTAQEKFFNKTGKGLHICVGLDTDVEKIPNHLRSGENAILDFNKVIIENTYHAAAAYKINFAFYEKYGAKGLKIIEETLKLIPSEVLTIADAKRGDIGNTSKMYAQSIFDHYNFDAVTLHPYMGKDSLSPFLDYAGKLHFVLVLTSNSGAADFEKLKLQNDKYLYQEVLDKVQLWNEKKNCGIVFGATNPEELKSNISNFSSLPVLLPGVGAQGGSLAEVVKAFRTEGNQNFIINISRALLYTDPGINFGKAANALLNEYNAEINSIRS